MPIPFFGHRWRNDVSAYVDGELGAARRGRFERHLAGCAGCASLVAEERALKQMLAAALPEVAPARSFLLSAEVAPIRRVTPARRPTAGSLVFLSRATGFAAAAAIFAIAVTVAIDVSDEGGGDFQAASRQSGDDGAAESDQLAPTTAAGGTADQAPASVASSTPEPTNTSRLGAAAATETPTPTTTLDAIKQSADASATAAASGFTTSGTPTPEARATDDLAFDAAAGDDDAGPNRLRAFQEALAIIATASGATWLLSRRAGARE